MERSYPPVCPACLASLPKGTEAPYRYRSAVKELIVALKYHGRLEVARFLAAGMARTVLHRFGPDPADAVVPVPLHGTRLRERGYNQARLLAVQLGRELSLPCRELLIRRRATAPQTRLEREARQANVRGAFELRPDPLAREGRFLLVDDVLTTGATLEACARALREGGAALVRAVTAAED